MKQHITVEQAEKELGKKYADGVVWLQEHGYGEYGKAYHKNNIFMNIGQMIEFLDERKTQEEWKLEKTTFHERGGWFWSIDEEKNYQRFLCDALWEAVKQLLEKEEGR